MDFRQTQPTNGRPATANTATASPNNKDSQHKTSRDPRWFNLLNVIVLFGVAILVAAIAFAFMHSSNDNEFKYVSTKKYQAVFLNNGQVYFGNIDSLNSKYVHMSNIYYLTQNSTTDSAGKTTASDYSLVKLGCQQIHDPFDEMVINRDQVTFWENLQDDGKVVSSIKQYVSQSKGKTKAELCAQVSNQTQATSSNAQGSATTPSKP